MWNVKCKCYTHSPSAVRVVRFKIVIKNAHLMKCRYYVGPLTLAVCQGKLKNVKEIMNCERRPGTYILLFLTKVAIAQKMVCIAKYLLPFIEDLNVLDENGRSLLYYALTIADKPLVDFIIQSGSDVNLKHNSGKTCLHFLASLSWIRETFQYLKNGMEFFKKYSVTFAELLISRGAHVNALCDSGLTPLDVAVAETNAGIIEVLLKRSANFENAIIFEILNSDYVFDIVKLFIDHGVDVNVQRELDGWTFLHKMIKDITFFPPIAEKLFGCIKLFLDNGANVNVPDMNGETAMHFLLLIDPKTLHFTEIVQLFLECGADLLRRTHKGLTPLKMLEYRFSKSDDVRVKILKRSFYGHLAGQSIDGCFEYANFLNKHNISISKSFVDKCIKEIETLKFKTFDNISLYDFYHANDEEVLSFLSVISSENIALLQEYLNEKHRHQAYMPLILRKINRMAKVIEIKSLFVCSKALINHVAEVFSINNAALDDCSELIYKHLNYVDIKNIAEAFKNTAGFKPPYKFTAAF